MKRFTVAVLALLLIGVASAHANLTASSPEAGAVLSEAPESVSLQFSEGLEAGFSTFKVYRLDADGVDLMAENAQQRLNGLAAVLVGEVLTVRDDGEAEARADTGFEPDAGVTEEVTVLLGELGEGSYVVMWSVLSVDTHPVQDHFVFSIQY